MEPFTVLRLMLLQILLFMMREFVCSNTGAPHHQLVSCLESDKEALLDFKSGLEDPQNWLFSWKGNNCCRWEGISCDNRTGAVIEIDLHCHDQYPFSSLGGKISPSITKLKSLRHLDLSYCSFDPIPIPDFFGSLENLQYLNLSFAGFNGTIPPNLGNLSSLQYLDLSYLYWARVVSNFEWVAGLVSLKHLDMSDVDLSSSLSNFSSLQILDVSGNQLNGSIPACFGEFKAMTQVQREIKSTHDGHYIIGCGIYNRDCPNYASYYKDKLAVSMKGQFLTFTKTLSLLVSLDLSGNSLSGEFPPEMTKLLGLVVLNLSGNHISGVIPESISNLKRLESLDFSSNRLSGPIPQSLESLSFLQYLNLSNNEFSGKIPYKDHMTTFEAPSFAGNPRLCGPPLVVTCPGDNKDGNSSKGWTRIDHHDSFVDNWFLPSVGLGFAAGLLVPFLLMAIIKSWGDAYFGLVNKVFERIALFTYRMRRATP